MNTDQVIEAYLQLRTNKEALQEKHKAELAPLNDHLGKLEAWLQQKLQSEGLQNFKGKSGTAFLQTATGVTCKDWQATLDWIKANNAWEFLEARVSKSVVQEFMENSGGDAPPGVSVTREVEVRIRRS